jgi:aconitate hydratase
MLAGRVVPPGVSLVVAPGSRQVLSMLARSGALAHLVDAGARLLETACGPCLGVGQAPRSGGVSVRSFNRNFAGRSGTRDASVYLASVQTCVASALSGKLTDPRDLGVPPVVSMPLSFHVDDSLIVPPDPSGTAVEVVRGPNIQPVPVAEPPGDEMNLEVLIALGDDITTDDILPAGATLLPLRSNIPEYAKHVFSRLDPDFPQRAEAAGRGCIVAGRNYGQGSSREHAAMAPLHLGVRAVLAQSFARIHRSNLVNFGLLPLVVAAAEASALRPGVSVRISGIHGALATDGGGEVRVTVEGGPSFTADLKLTAREAAMLRAGGLLNHLRSA